MNSLVNVWREVCAQVRFADAKLAFAFGVIASLTSFLMKSSLIIQALSYFSGGGYFFTVSGLFFSGVIVSILLCIAALVLLGIAFFPALSSQMISDFPRNIATVSDVVVADSTVLNEQKNLIYFGDVVQFGSLSIYRDSVAAAFEIGERSRLFLDVTQQIFRVSRLGIRKFAFLRISIWMTMPGLCLWLASFVMQILPRME